MAFQPLLQSLHLPGRRASFARRLCAVAFTLCCSGLGPRTEWMVWWWIFLLPIGMRAKDAVMPGPDSAQPPVAAAFWRARMGGEQGRRGGHGDPPQAVEAAPPRRPRARGRSGAEPHATGGSGVRRRGARRGARRAKARMRARGGTVGGTIARAGRPGERRRSGGCGAHGGCQRFLLAADDAARVQIRGRWGQGKRGNAPAAPVLTRPSDDWTPGSCRVRARRFIRMNALHWRGCSPTRPTRGAAGRWCAWCVRAWL